VAVVSVPYRLSPEHVWPACAEDVEAAALWLLDRAPALFGAGRLAIGGESAGAHLAAVTLMRLRAAGRLGAVAGAVLNYGVFDLRLTPSMARWGAENLVLSTPVVEWFVDNLTAGDRTLRADPALSPLLGHLGGLPPALVQVGTYDPLIDDSLALAAGMVAAGGRVELRLFPGGVHGFDRFHTALADEANAAVAAFLAGLF
jgi:acetyl esterase/lipase